MYRRFLPAFAALLVGVSLPAIAAANARLVSVTPKDGGCVAAPVGPNVEAWDVQPGMTYTVRLDRVTECANAGTDPFVSVMVMSSARGNALFVARHVADGTYEFDTTIPPNACGTTPIRYGLTGTLPNTGWLVGRHDSGTAQSHLRAATFGPGCTSASPIVCATTSTLARTWGELKSIYR